MKHRSPDRGPQSHPYSSDNSHPLIWICLNNFILGVRDCCHAGTAARRGSRWKEAFNVYCRQFARVQYGHGMRMTILAVRVFGARLRTGAAIWWWGWENRFWLRLVTGRLCLADDSEKHDSVCRDVMILLVVFPVGGVATIDPYSIRISILLVTIESCRGLSNVSEFSLLCLWWRVKILFEELLKFWFS